MNKEDIIRMALEADFRRDNKGLYGTHESDITPLLERFAALVAAEVAKCEACGAPHALYCLTCCEESIVQTAVKEEREACAQVCDKRAADYQMGFEEKYEAQACAYDIRARGEA